MALPNTPHALCRANATGLLPYLIPFLHQPATSFVPSRASFSTSQCLRKRDNNRLRGMSALRGTGLRKRMLLSVRNEPLPQPVLDRPNPYSETVTPEDHGLWQFFGKERRCMTTPEEENAHGREWTTAELRNRTFEDLHRLWWVCVKERNRIATNQAERERLKAGYGKFEARARDEKVKSTMTNIRSTLIERWDAYNDALELAMVDPEVDLSGKGPAYTPSPYEEDELYEGEGEDEKVALLEGQQAGERSTASQQGVSTDQRAVI